MKINEIFYSIQGEIDVGKPTIFIRTQGCNMEPKCDFCDSSYSWNEGKEMSIKDIYDKIENWLEKCNYIVFTGGEPMQQIEEIYNFTRSLNYKKNVNYGLETNGLIFNDNIFIFDNISISPKKQNYNLETLSKLNTNKSRFKFVYEKDLWFENVIEKLDLEPYQIWIMPEGKTKLEQEQKMKEVVEYCKEKGYNFTPRLHTLIWDNRRAK